MGENLELVEAACVHCNHMVGIVVAVGAPVSLVCRDCKRVLYTREEATPTPVSRVPKPKVKERVPVGASTAQKGSVALDDVIAGPVAWKPGEIERARRLLDW